MRNVMTTLFDEAREAGFLVASGTCMRQLTPQTVLIIEQETAKRFIFYRIKWDAKNEVEEEKFYCRGTWIRCLNKAKGIIEFYESKVFKSKKVS